MRCRWALTDKNVDFVIGSYVGDLHMDEENVLVIIAGQCIDYYLSYEPHLNHASGWHAAEYHSCVLHHSHWGRPQMKSVLPRETGLILCHLGTEHVQCTVRRETPCTAFSAIQVSQPQNVLLKTSLLDLPCDKVLISWWITSCCSDFVAEVILVKRVESRWQRKKTIKCFLMANRSWTVTTCFLEDCITHLPKSQIKSSTKMRKRRRRRNKSFPDDGQQFRQEIWIS